MAVTLGIHTLKGAINPASVYTTPGQTTTAGSSIYMGFATQSGQFSSVSDSKGNVWTQVGTEITYGAGGDISRVYVNDSGTRGASHTFSLNLGASTFALLFVVEVLTTDPISSLDQQDRVADATSPVTSPTINTTLGDSALITFEFSNSSGSDETHTTGGSFASGDKLDEQNLTLDVTGCSGAKVVTVTGAYNSAVTVGGSTLSDAVCWIISVKGLSGPIINTQPADIIVYVSDTAAFSVTATASAGSLTYQWQVSTDFCATFSNVSTGTGGTTANYTTAATDYASDQIFFRCAVTDSNGTTNTRAASLRIIGRASLAWMGA